MINLILGDCLDKLKDIPEKSVDLVVIDPPYKIDSTKVNPNAKTGAFGSTKRNFHSELLSMNHGITNEVLDQLVRVMSKINIYMV